MSKYYAKYLTLFISLGAYSTFLPVFLEKSLNFSTSHIGMILSIPSILGIVFVPIWGIISDVSKKRKTILFINLFMCLLLTFVFMSTKSFLFIFLICSLFEIFKSPLLPLTDSLSTSFCKVNNKNYGRIRVMGSATFAIASFLCGYLMKITNNNYMFFYVFMVGIIGCLILTPLLDTSSDLTKNKKEKLNLRNDLPQLLKNKNYILILICGICISSLTEAMISYQGIHLMDLGASTDMVGLLIIFMVCPELFFMVKTKELLDKYGLIKMLMFASFILLLRWVVYYFTSTPLVFMIATSFHGIATSIITIGAFDFIGKVVDSKLYTTSMTLYTFVVGVSFSLLKLLYGYMINFMGIKSIFILSMIISLSTLILLKSVNVASENSCPV